jgi:hypothetical protein
MKTGPHISFTLVYCQYIEFPSSLGGRVPLAALIIALGSSSSCRGRPLAWTLLHLCRLILLRMPHKKAKKSARDEERRLK